MKQYGDIVGLFLSILAILFLFSPSVIGDIARVKRVVDGDTLLLTNAERVRLISVDTPETKHPEKPVQRSAKEAYFFTRKMVKGKKVRLEYDWQKLRVRPCNNAMEAEASFPS